MELLFDLIFEFFGEFLLQLVLEALAEVGLQALHRARNEPAPPRPLLRALGFIVFGAVAGGLSLWLLPHSLVRTEHGRVVYLLLAPVGIGATMALIGSMRDRRGQDRLGLDRFAYGYLFALSMALVRFQFTAVT